jgi:hypothetical protein
MQRVVRCLHFTGEQLVLENLKHLLNQSFYLSAMYGTAVSTPGLHTAA